jgi:hypothetical protein
VLNDPTNGGMPDDDVEDAPTVVADDEEAV